MSHRTSLHAPAAVGRRSVLKTLAAGAATAAVGFPHVARAQATKLSLGLWDHWVPGANNVLKSIVEEWGKANKVEVHIDFITSIGNKLQLTGAAEARAGSGHDILAFWRWDSSIYRDKLEPLNDVADTLQKKYGKFDENATWLSRIDGKWVTLPSPIGSHTYPFETRMDVWKQHAGIDVVDIFPADVRKRDKKKVDAWDWKMFLGGAKKVHAAGVPFGASIAENSDSNSWLAPLFLSFGAMPMNDKGDITIESAATLEALEFLTELVKSMPPDIYGWDDASNNRLLISGKGSSIVNPPSAWAVAKRDRPDVASQVWHHDMARGPKGRFRGSVLYTWGVWKFSKSKSAAKDLLVHVSSKEPQWKLITAADGYDVPQIPAFYEHPVWAETGPPKGTQYNYIIRGDERVIVPGWPAKHEYAAQIDGRWLLPTMVGKVTSGGISPKEAMKWAAKELEGYKRG